MSIAYIEGLLVIISKKLVLFKLSEDFLFLASSVDPDEMLHYVAFHLGLHCLSKYLNKDLQLSKG